MDDGPEFFFETCAFTAVKTPAADIAGDMSTTGLDDRGTPEPDAPQPLSGARMPSAAATPVPRTALPWPRASGPGGRVLEILGQTRVFRDADDTVYATLPDTGQTVPLDSLQLRDHVTACLWQTQEERPSAAQMRAALDDARTWGRLAGEVKPVGLRVGKVDGRLYLDLGGADGRVVEIDTTGWRVVTTAPLCFLRPPGMGALPEPARGGSIDLLRRYLPVGEDDFRVAVAWLLTTLRAAGPFPILYLTGPQGSAKSTTTRLLKTVLDPDSATLRRPSATEEDLFVSAQTSHVLAFDNISQISDQISDALCRIATGGTFSRRKRFTDTQEVRLTASRPILLNGIVDAAGRPDLADRLFRLELRRPTEEERVCEHSLHAAFTVEHPLILGALLDLAVVGLRAQGAPRLRSGLRMVDAANWAQACASGFTTEAEIVAALTSSRDRVVSDLVSVSPVAQAILRLAEHHRTWRGTATALLGEVRRLTPREEKNVPSGAAQLAAEIQRLEADLRAMGVDIERRRVGHRGERHILISHRDTPAGNERDLDA